MIKTILVATDGSDHAGKALTLAGDLSVKSGSRLVLVHVRLSHARSKTLQALADHRALTKPQRELLDSYEGDYLLGMARAGVATDFTSVPPPFELVQAIGEQIIKRAEKTARKAGVKTVLTVIADGEAADAILECASGEKADMIILGSRRLSDLKGFFLGSVSHKVDARAECTCVTVK